MKQFIVIMAVAAYVAADAPVYGNNNYNNNGYNSNNNNNNPNNHGYNNNNNIYPNPNNNVPITRFENTNNGEGGYNYAYETGDGTSAQEQGYLKDADSPSAQGAFGFVAPDGQHFSISYTADENGFLPQGAHIPTPPPIPEDILKSLEQNRADEARGVVDDGQYHPDPSPHQQYNNAQRAGHNGGY